MTMDTPLPGTSGHIEYCLDRMRAVAAELFPEVCPELECDIFEVMLCRAVAEKIMQQEILETEDMAAAWGDSVSRHIILHVEMLRRPQPWHD
jgi:hypothetical protein